MAKLREQPPQPVDHRRALGDEALSDPMQRQMRLLRFILHRHEAHRGPLHRFADRSGVRRVVLAALAESR